MINTVFIMGKVAREPKTTGTSLFFTVKTSENYKDKEGQSKWDNQYHNITVFGQAAARLARTIQENADVFVEGKLSTYKAKDGTYKTSVLAKTVRVLSGARSENDDSDLGAPEQEGAFPEDIPF